MSINLEISCSSVTMSSDDYGDLTVTCENVDTANLDFIAMIDDINIDEDIAADEIITAVSEKFTGRLLNNFDQTWVISEIAYADELSEESIHTLLSIFTLSEIVDHYGSAELQAAIDDHKSKSDELRPEIVEQDRINGVPFTGRQFIK